MLERLGHVLGWAGNIFAVLFIAFSIFVVFDHYRSDREEGTVAQTLRAQGKSDAEILTSLTALQDKIGLAKKEGYNDSEIVNHLIASRRIPVPMFFVWVGIGLAAASYLAGKALRYIFAGSQPAK